MPKNKNGLGHVPSVAGELEEADDYPKENSMLYIIERWKQQREAISCV
jgi:hypothetical protein